jgi:hypothetical protein
VAANSFAGAGSADAAANDEIIALNHIGKSDDNFGAAGGTS